MTYCVDFRGANPSLILLPMLATIYSIARQLVISKRFLARAIVSGRTDARARSTECITTRPKAGLTWEAVRFRRTDPYGFPYATLIQSDKSLAPHEAWVF
jgi:hypothetical protein